MEEMKITSAIRSKERVLKLVISKERSVSLEIVVNKRGIANTTCKVIIPVEIVLNKPS